MEFVENRDIKTIEDDLVARGVLSKDGLEPGDINIDSQFAEQVNQQLDRYNLNPDGETFYLCDTGIGHGIKIAKELEKKGVSTQVITDKSSSGDEALVRQKRSKELYGKPGKVNNPQGSMIAIDGHASILERKAASIISSLPNSDSLNAMGVKKVVLLAEADFGGELQTDKSYYLHVDLPVIKYLNKLSDSGTRTFAVGAKPKL